MYFFNFNQFRPAFDTPSPQPWSVLVLNPSPYDMAEGGGGYVVSIMWGYGFMHLTYVYIYIHIVNIFICLFFITLFL